MKSFQDTVAAHASQPDVATCPTPGQAQAMIQVVDLLLCDPHACRQHLARAALLMERFSGPWRVSAVGRPFTVTLDTTAAGEETILTFFGPDDRTVEIIATDTAVLTGRCHSPDQPVVEIDLRTESDYRSLSDYLFAGDIPRTDTQ